MADYFDSDEAITRDYDSRIAKRLLHYIAPYWKLALVALVALVLDTAGELYTPVLEKDTVDNALVVSYYAVDPHALSTPEGKSITIKPDDPVVAGRAVLPASRFSGLSAADRKILESKALIGREPGYIAAYDPSNAGQNAAIKTLGHLAIVDNGYIFAPLSAVKKLPSAEAAALRAADSRIISRNVILLLIILFVVLVAGFIESYIANLIGQRVMKDLRMELFRHTESRSLSFLSRQPVGRLVTRMTSDVETINEFFTDVVASFLKDASLMAGVLVVLLLLDWKLALITLATLPPVAIVTGISRRKSRDAFRRQRTWLSKVNSYIAERLAGINVVKLFARENASRSEFEQRDTELMKANLGEVYVYATFRPLVDFLGSLTTAIVIYAGASLFGAHLLSLGTLIAFVNLIGMFYSPIQDISEKYTILQSAMAGGERVFKLLDEKEEIPDNPKRPMPSRLRGHLQFDHVGFAYKEGEPVLRDVCFNVEPGEMVAIVGYTGAGKTTITNLITRLWDVQSGEIRIDGIPIRDMPLAGLRSQVQSVLQDVFLFSGTIDRNIRLGGDISAERMKLAAEAVHADEFIDSLPDGYNTVLTEGATNLSGGQRQLLSFARVLAHDPSIIILDEATSAVDTETELMIQRGVEGLLKGRTSVVIAHRLSTIRNADRIIVLSGGRVVEEGKHDALLNKRGLYWKLYQLQYGGTEETV